MPTCDTITNLDDVVNAAIIKTTVFVGEELLKDHAILSHSVHDSFTSYAKELLTATNLESEVVEVTILVTSRWILSNLTANLKHHISYSCQARNTAHYCTGQNQTCFLP